ncbi:MAG: porin [bacterium]|nr:porin [bacterium]
MKRCGAGVIFAALLLIVGAVSAASDDKPIRVKYDDGLEIETAEGNYRFHIEWRAQLRFENLDAGGFPDEPASDNDEFSINRLRFKMGGHAYRPWLRYYTEYDLEGGRLLDLRFEVARSEKAIFRVGQFKVLYNRERIDSSGKQQFAERSIVTRTFTVDRQQGLTLRGRLFEGSHADSSYAVGVFSGTGRSEDGDGDGRPMYVARWQWNFLGRDVRFTASDIDRTDKLAAALAVGAVSNRSRYTRFSSSGGGQLDGFADGEEGQYEIEQSMVEFALRSRGLYVEGEWHRKEIDDRVADATTDLDGYYVQVGYFFHELFEAFPDPLELAGRYARVRREGDPLRSGEETTLVANWFFSGHRNKLTADISRLENLTDGPEEQSETRLRLQWDVSF